MMPINRKSIVSLSATASYDELFETLDQDGCVILEKLTSSNTTDSIQRELSLDIQNTLPGNGDFVGYKTKRTHTVLTNSKTAGLLALESTTVLAQSRTRVVPMQVYCYMRRRERRNRGYSIQPPGNYSHGQTTAHLRRQN